MRELSKKYNSPSSQTDRGFREAQTVKAHMKHIMEKLGASDRTQAVAIAARRGIIHL